jgi:hypothetical protein
VLVLIIVLALTNVVTVAVLVRLMLRPVDHPQPDTALATSLNASRSAVPQGGTRRVITIEILNPIELAGKRGRLVGIAGSFAPGITRRVVYDQALKLVRRELAEHRVVADVRLHVVRGDGAATPPAGEPVVVPADPTPRAEAQPEPWVDLVKREDDQSE